MRAALVEDVSQSLDSDDRRKDLAVGSAEYPEGEEATEADYCAFTRAFVEEQTASLEHLHNTWIESLLFLAGLQNHRKTPAGTWEREKAAKWREFPVTNLCLPYFKHIMAKMLKNRVAWIAQPASTDPDDIQAAKLAEDVLEAKWVELGMARVVRRAIAWLIPTGNAFLYPFWNERTGKLRALTAPVLVARVDAESHTPVGEEEVEAPCDEKGDPITNEDGSLNLEARPHYIDEGEIGCRVFSPFQVYVDASAENDDDVTTVVIVEPLSTREARRRWPKFANRISNDDDIGLLEDFDQLMSGIIAGGSDMALSSGHTSRDEQESKVLVYYYHEKQTPEFPFGRFWICTSSVMLEDPTDLPDQIWPPIEHLIDVEVPGRYHGRATHEDLVGLNREYNQCNGFIKEHHKLLLRGKWLVPIGSMVTRSMITTEPGQTIQHTPGMPPVQADIKPLPQQVYLERERILADYRMVSGVNKVSFGQAPPGVTAGRAFLILQEADDTDLGPLIEMLELCVASLAWKFLQIIQYRYDEERLITITGANRSFQSKFFKGSDLSGVANIRAQAGSAFPWSQSARQSFMLEILSARPELFMDEETGQLDRSRIARLLPVAGMDSISSFEDIDLNEAMREEEQYRDWDGNMANANALPQPMPWQNLLAHHRQHTRTLKSAEFESWPIPNRTAFLLHWQMTDEALKAKRMEDAMLAGIASGQMQGPNAKAQPGAPTETSNDDQ